jgi:lactoylglutathione lyase
MLIGLNFVLLHVPDIAAATTFYTEKLGFTVEGQAPDFVQFKQPAGIGAIFALSKGEATPSQTIELWWFVDNADTTLADLKAKGVAVVDEAKDEPFGRTFSIKDPAGYTLYMLQPKQAQQ